MKKLTSLYIVFLLTMLGFQGNLKAQVSHGGRPLPLSLMRSTNGQMFKEMPPFDVQEELRIDSLNESDLRSGFRFAYKFITDYNRYNSGVTFTGPDGTRVWRLGIYSPGALSINVLFTEYELHTLGIASYFDDIFISSSCGVKKPDAGFYQMLLEKHQIDVKTAVMIGNDAISDIAGAKGVGLSTFYIHSNISPELKGEVEADDVLLEMDLAEVKRRLLGDEKA